MLNPFRRPVRISVAASRPAVVSGIAASRVTASPSMVGVKRRIGAVLVCCRFKITPSDGHSRESFFKQFASVLSLFSVAH